MPALATAYSTSGASERRHIAQRASRFAAACLLTAIPTSSIPESDNSETLLRELVARNELMPLVSEPFDPNPKYLLGQALFFDRALSGTRDVACASCHRMEHATTDGKSLGVRVNGDIGHMHFSTPPRNTPDLFNRDNNDVTALFWDGRVEAKRSNGNIRFQSPQGVFSHRDVENLLALQSLTPLTTVEEMLGTAQTLSHSDLPDEHARKANEVADVPAFATEATRAISAASQVVDRLLGRNAQAVMPWQQEYRRMFQAAYPDRSLSDYSFANVGNALAHFQEVAFATRDTPWDRYLGGDSSALSEEAKSGAIYFLDGGRCFTCHRGVLFSDFQFHAVRTQHTRISDARAMPSLVDLGRYAVTGREDDKQKFRTPPLRNVTLTAPYFHDGSAPTLEIALTRHLQALGGDEPSIDVDQKVGPKVRQETARISELVAFLETLEDKRARSLARFRPASVPSDLPLD